MLVGREAERAAVDRLLAGARVGESGVLVVNGAAGIGKTVLLEHAAASSAGMQVLQATGSASEREVAFGGLLQLLRPKLDVIERIPGPQAEALSVALALRDGDAGDRFAIGAATLSLLTRCAEDRPLLVLLDDAHWLDRPSLDAIVFVARRLLTDGIAVLAGARDEEEPEPLRVLPHLPLTGITLDDATRLLSAHDPPVVAPDVVRRLHRATGGNPLAMLELAAEADEVGRLSPEVPVPVPDVLAEAYGRRIAQLDRPSLAALLLTAVADGDLAVVASAAPALATEPDRLGAAVDAGLLTISAGRARFRHPVVRSSVYAAAPVEERRRAHLAVGQALPESDLERRTWHLSEATVGFDDVLAGDLERVAARSRNRSAYAVAATALERASLHTADRDRRAGRLLEAGEAAWLGGEHERTLALLAESAALGDDPIHRAAVDGLRGTVSAHTGSLVSARDMLIDAASRLRDAQPATAARLLADAVLSCVWMGDVPGGLRAAELLDGLDSSRLDERATVLAGMASGMALVLAGRPGIDRIRVAVERLEGSSQPLDDPLRPGSSLAGALFLRESGVGRRVLERNVKELRARAAIATLPSLLIQVARDAATTDRWRQALTHYEETITLAEEVGHQTELTMALAGSSQVLARMGREEPCREAAARAIALAEQHQAHLARVWAEFALGDLALTLGRPDEAVTHYRALMATLHDIGLDDVDVFPGPELVEALTRLGEAVEAREIADRYWARAEAKGQPWALARAERMLASLAPGDVAERRFAAALELHARSPDLYEEARTRLALGSMLRRQRRRVDARPQLRAAVTAFEALGADAWADSAAAELAATGETPSRRGDSALDRLTSQELQVCRMLADGHTTRQTAAALFLSPKTVEYHLRKVYTKLDIHSRAELAEALAGTGSGEAGVDRRFPG